MEESPVTVEQVREAQENLKTGLSHHESKAFSEAIESFKKASSIHPFDTKHLEELQKKLKTGGFKKQQESIAYMGCAAVHLNRLIHELGEDKRAEVPIDEQLMNVFKEWN